MKAPTRQTPAGRAYRDLQNLGRRQKRPTEELLVLYSLEGFLDRLASSKQHSEFVLKGGVLLAAYAIRRPTRDIDLSVRGIGNENGAVLKTITEIASIARDDGLTFDSGTAAAETIREEDDYSGVRVSMTAQLATARIPFCVDVNVGDPMSPGPRTIKLPRLLGGEIALRGYPLSMVFAEKLVTALQRGTANTRWRDFADIYLLSGTHAVEAGELQQSLKRVAAHRGVMMRPLEQVLGGYGSLAQSKWRAWVARQRLSDRLPAVFDELLAAVFTFSDGPLASTFSAAEWRPHPRQWMGHR